MKYGYARCSTTEDKQDINRQIRELKAAGADEVVFEYEHGDAKVKQNLNMLLEHAAEGDTIITLEVSRLTRSTQQLCEIVESLKRKCLCLVIVGSITVNCRSGQIDPMSQAFVQMSAVFAELELSKQGIPQLALCEYLGLARQTFTKWKNGESRSYYQRIAAIADYLDVSVSYLLDFEYEKVRSDRLTPMEREIIRRYRRLDEPMQDWLLTAIKLAGGEKRAKKQASKKEETHC